jgi:hypothetical protein
MRWRRSNFPLPFLPLRPYTDQPNKAQAPQIGHEKTEKREERNEKEGPFAFLVVARSSLIFRYGCTKEMVQQRNVF